MKQRRTFTKQFKNEIVKAFLQKTKTAKDIRAEYQIEEAHLNRWVEAFLAVQWAKHKALPTTSTSTQFVERRRDHADTAALKAKIADLYMKLERQQVRDV